MQNAPAFKKRYIAAVFLIAAFAYSVYLLMTFSPFEETIIRKTIINSSTMFYITEGSAGATTKHVYQYYLVPTETTEVDFFKGKQKKYIPFLSTSDEHVQTQIDGNVIRLKVRGDIYRFTNAASYSTTIYLIASPF